MRKVSVLLAGLILLGAAAAFAADLTIDMQVNVAAKDYANNYLTFKGGNNSVDKDQFALGPDGVTGASKLNATELFNGYRLDVKGKKTMPGGLRNLFLFAVADDATRTGDNLKVTRAGDGAITIRYVHRGSAYEIVTDRTGKITLPGTPVRTRKIGHTDNVIHTDFSSSGKAANVDWGKVWNAGIADGKQVGSTASRTGKIGEDAADSEIFTLQGALQVTLTGNIMKITGELNAVKR